LIPVDQKWVIEYGRRRTRDIAEYEELWEYEKLTLLTNKWALLKRFDPKSWDWLALPLPAGWEEWLWHNEKTWVETQKLTGIQYLPPRPNKFKQVPEHKLYANRREARLEEWRNRRPVPYSYQWSWEKQVDDRLDWDDKIDFQKLKKKRVAKNTLIDDDDENYINNFNELNNFDEDDELIEEEFFNELLEKHDELWHIYGSDENITFNEEGTVYDENLRENTTIANDYILDNDFDDDTYDEDEDNIEDEEEEEEEEEYYIDEEAERISRDVSAYDVKVDHAFIVLHQFANYHYAKNRRAKSYQYQLREYTEKVTIKLTGLTNKIINYDKRVSLLEWVYRLVEKCYSDRATKEKKRRKIIEYYHHYVSYYLFYIHKAEKKWNIFFSKCLLSFWSIKWLRLWGSFSANRSKRWNASISNNSKLFKRNKKYKKYKKTYFNWKICFKR